MKKTEKESFAQKATSDKEQKKWENKELGTDKEYSKKSDFYKPPSKLVSIRIPEETLTLIKDLAEKKGLKYQTYIISLLKNHVEKKAD